MQGGRSPPCRNACSSGERSRPPAALLRKLGATALEEREHARRVPTLTTPDGAQRLRSTQRQSPSTALLTVRPPLPPVRTAEHGGRVK
ncbi:hypothetical protein MRX96_035498 [Rhipicephalus microplus]